MLTELNHFLVSLYSRLQVHREEGQTLVEYVLILSLVSLAVVGALTGLAGAIGAKLEAVANQVTTP